MSEYKTDDYIDFVMQKRYDKISPHGIDLLVSEIITARSVESLKSKSPPVTSKVEKECSCMRYINFSIFLGSILATIIGLRFSSINF